MSDFNPSDLNNNADQSEANRNSTSGFSATGNSLQQAGIGTSVENAARWVWRRIRGGQH
ncbi:MAG: hypothetical protein AAF215_00010 [Cyanobacteria bacterium P01_A01_bin.123]